MLQFLSRESGADIEDRGVKVIREETPASLPENTLLRTRAGTTLPVEDIASPIRNMQGDIVGSVVVFRDVTERARIEDERARAVKELIATNQRLRFAQRAARAGIWVWVLGSDQFLWSDEYYDVSGLDPAQTRPTYENWLASVHEADRERVDREARQGLERCGELVIEYRIRHPRRGIRWLAVIGETICSADGRPLHMTGITLDITERKVAEEALRENDRRKDEFLAMLAHELRNPLAAISNAVQLVRPARDPGGHRVGDGGHRAAGEAPRPPDRRPAGRLPHHPRQDPAPQGAHRRSRPSSTVPSRRCGRSSRSGSTS